MKVYAAVIGAGASGMICAIRAAERHPDKRFVLLEKADRVGKKILVTGNGRCNLTNIHADARSYSGKGSGELINILYEKYDPETVLQYFRGLGLFTRADSEGRVYPLSNTASSVLDVLRRRIGELDISVICGADISGIRHSQNGYKITSDSAVIYAEKVVIAVGGKTDYAGRESGSGSILGMLKEDVSDLSPGLSPVRVKSDLLPSLKGIRADAEARLIINGKVIGTERGEVQFTENSLSGICIFNLSREANRHGGEISLNLLPDMSVSETEDELKAGVRRNPNAQATDIFTGIFHKNIGIALLKSSGIKPSEICGNISDKEIKTLCKNISDKRFACLPSKDFKKAQVTCGGVALSRIDPHTFEHIRHKGLYIIGEALDIDGVCGGYNLQFAWASGLCAGDSV